MTNLLMICTGNICRSPIAEGFATVLGLEYGCQIQSKSASTLGLLNRPADPKSVKVCKEIGIDISQHKSQPITQELVDWADYILVMERKHAQHVRMGYENVDDKVLELGSFGGLTSIKDPIGGWTYRFRSCRKEIERSLRNFIQQMPKG